MAIETFYLEKSGPKTQSSHRASNPRVIEYKTVTLATEKPECKPVKE